MTKIFIIIKFSVEYQLAGHRAMQLAKASRRRGPLAYQKKLFENKRMQERFSFFEKITLPSLTSALKNKNTHLIVLSSLNLPDEFKLRLNALLKDFNNAVIEYCPPIKSVDEESGRVVKGILLKEFYEAGTMLTYATVRLDDDDALSSNFIDQLSPFVRPEFSGLWVSFPYGLRMSIGKNKVIITAAYLPKTSQGLSRISSVCTIGDWKVETAYDLGSHARIDKRAPTILDARQLAYVRVNHSCNDSGMRRFEWLRHWLQVSAEPEISLSEMKQIFSFNPEEIGPISGKSTLQKLLRRFSKLLYQNA